MQEITLKKNIELKFNKLNLFLLKILSKIINGKIMYCYKSDGKVWGIIPDELLGDRIETFTYITELKKDCIKIKLGKKITIKYSKKNIIIMNLLARTIKAAIWIGTGWTQKRDWKDIKLKK